MSADVAYAVSRAFSDHFRAYLDGRQTKQETKQAVANLLIDEEPSMIDDFMQVCLYLSSCPQSHNIHKPVPTQHLLCCFPVHCSSY